MSTEKREWDYKVVTLIREVDGDTAWLTVEKEIKLDFGFFLVETQTKQWSADFRFLNIDTWERKQPGGAKATLDSTLWIMAAIGEGVLRGQTFKTDDFGRWLIDLYRTDTGEHLSDYLRTQGDEKIK